MSNANIFFRHIDDDTMQSLPVTDGNLIFNKTDHVIYLDNEEGQRERYGGEVVIDSDFSDTSINPLQNKQVSKLIKTLKTTLSKDGWTPTKPYKQSVVVNGMTDKGRPDIDLALGEDDDEPNDKLREKNFGFIKYYVTSENSIEFVCKYKKPTIDLPILIEGIY